MKYLILSDIHGVSSYLKDILNKVNDYDKLIILGDILYHGPRNNIANGYNPKEVIEILTSLKDKIIAIRGNCDARVDAMILKIELKDLRWININNKKICLTHGDLYNKDNLPSKLKRYVMLYGHYHKNEIIKINDKITLVNVGSLSLPKDNHHTYSIIEDNLLISYDLNTNEEILKLEL